MIKPTPNAQQESRFLEGKKMQIGMNVLLRELGPKKSNAKVKKKRKKKLKINKCRIQRKVCV